jgi:hypothetical protein
MLHIYKSLCFPSKFALPKQEPFHCFTNTLLTPTTSPSSLTMSSSNLSDKVAQNPASNHLERQVTLQLNSEQYERLFFQPTQAKGDLAKRLGTSFHSNY